MFSQESLLKQPTLSVVKRVRLASQVLKCEIPVRELRKLWLEQKQKTTFEDYTIFTS